MDSAVEEHRSAEQEREWRLPRCRSYLYVPATKPELLEKALASETDAVIIDLEDGVALQRKPQAREFLVEMLAAERDKPVYVRINQLRSEFAEGDLECAANLPIAGVRIPKVRNATDLVRACDQLRASGFRGGVQVQLENAEGVMNMREIAFADPLLEMLSLGEGDLSSELSCDRERLWPKRLEVILLSRAAGLQKPIQAGYPGLSASEQPEKKIHAGKKAGFFGCIAVHPAQVPTINHVYTPCVHEVDYARDALLRLDDMIRKGQTTTRDNLGKYLSEFYRAEGEGIMKDFYQFGSVESCLDCAMDNPSVEQPEHHYSDG